MNFCKNPICKLTLPNTQKASKKCNNSALFHDKAKNLLKQPNSYKYLNYFWLEVLTGVFLAKARRTNRFAGTPMEIQRDNQMVETILNACPCPGFSASSHICLTLDS